MKTALGIDIGASKTAAALVTSEATIYDRKEIVTPTDSQEKFFDRSASLVKSFNLLEVESIGVGFPGVVENGIVITSTNLNFIQFALAENLSKMVNKPVVAANDADMALKGEVWLGAAQGKKNIIMLTLGTGVGGAMSSRPNAELGHTIIDPGSVLSCAAGHRGDIEALIGGRATESRLGKPMARLLTEASYQTFFVKWLAQAVDFLIKQYSPEIVVLGGGVTGSAAYFFNKLPLFSVPVVLAKLGANAGIFGAAKAAMEGGL